MVEILLAPSQENNKKSIGNSENAYKRPLPHLPLQPPQDIPHLIANHWEMATCLANNYRNIPGIEFEDILQHSRMALFKAAQRFDHSRGNAFSTFAWCSIRNELNSLYIRQKKYAYRECHFSTPPNWDGDNSTAFENSIPCPNRDAISTFTQKETYEALQDSIRKLPVNLRKIVIGILEQRDYKEIGRKMGYSQASSKTLVSRGYRHALKLMREDMQRKGFDLTCLN